MEKKGIQLDCCCEYDNSIIYRFITEELFDFEIDDISIDGMMWHFVYEEFHPNHDYDLRRYAREFTEDLLTRKWDAEFDTNSLSKIVTFKDTTFNNDEISSIIADFQQDRTFKIEKFDIEKVAFDVAKGEAEVHARLAYHSSGSEGDQLHEGEATYSFTLSNDYWYISGFVLPGFGRSLDSSIAR
jgi:hypothetical protein